MIRSLSYAFFVLFLATGPFTFAAREEMSPCDEKEEAAREKEDMECDRREKRSDKEWKSATEAKKEVLEFLKSGSIDRLIEYKGCDAGNTVQNEIICSSYVQRLQKSDLVKASESFQKKSEAEIKKGKWVLTGASESIEVFCMEGNGKDLPINPCKSDQKVPIVEIRKSKKGYYLFGVPMD